MQFAMGILLSALLAVGASAATPPSPRRINVAAAADLTFAFRDVAARFEKRTGIGVDLSFGSSGNFFSQIENGAPYDLYFSADIRYPEQLEAGGLVEPGSLYTYAKGKLVLWVPNDSPVDLRRGLAALLDPRVAKVAIANPRHAPYGRAAMAALKHAGVADKMSKKLVLGENIAQTAQFVLSHNADAGILALSLALAPTMKGQGRYVELPASSYPPLRQAGVILKSSPRKDLARQFMAFLREPAAVSVMRSYGFAVPEATAAGTD
jgi:molybdate transport system substrate-binding protein